MTVGKSREVYIDIIKSIAIIFVLTIHVCTLGGYGAPLCSFAFGSTVFWGAITRAAVPLFLMCTGALMLEPSRELPIKKLFLHNILHLIIALLFWAAVYKIYDLWLSNGFGTVTFADVVKELLFFKHESHLYYIHVSLLLYLFLPIGRVFAANATKRQYIYLLLFWFVFGILYPSVKRYYPFNQLTGIPIQYLMNLTYSAIGYAMLGYFLKKYTPRLCIGAAVFISGAVFTFLFTFLMSVRHGYFYDLMLNGMTVGVCLMAFGLFSTVKRLCDKKPLKLNGFFVKTVTYASKASFCAYLIHMFFLNFAKKQGMTVLVLPPIICIPICVVSLLTVCLLIYYPLSKLPVIRKWMI